MSRSSQDVIRLLKCLQNVTTYQGADCENDFQPSLFNKIGVIMIDWVIQEFYEWMPLCHNIIFMIISVRKYVKCEI